jgi:hypothetical protein
MQSWIPFTSPESNIFESLFAALRPARQQQDMKMTDRNTFDSSSVSLCLCGEKALAERNYCASLSVRYSSQPGKLRKKLYEGISAFV